MTRSLILFANNCLCGRINGSHLAKRILKTRTAFLLYLLCFGLNYNTTTLAAAIEFPSDDMRQQLIKTINNINSFDDRFEAEVWLVDMNHRLKRMLPDTEKRLKVLKLAHQYASASNLSPQLVLSVIEVESHFDHYAVSSAGAQGLMQIMPFWKKELGRIDDNLADIETNMRYGCAILSYYIKKENGNLVKALARYNGSRGETWYPEKVMIAWERHWFVREY